MKKLKKLMWLLLCMIILCSCASPKNYVLLERVAKGEIEKIRYKRLAQRVDGFNKGDSLMITKSWGIYYVDLLRNASVKEDYTGENLERWVGVLVEK